MFKAVLKIFLSVCFCIILLIVVGFTGIEKITGPIIGILVAAMTIGFWVYLDSKLK